MPVCGIAVSHSDFPSPSCHGTAAALLPQYLPRGGGVSLACACGRAVVLAGELCSASEPSPARQGSSRMQAERRQNAAGLLSSAMLCKGFGLEEWRDCVWGVSAWPKLAGVRLHGRPGLSSFGTDFREVALGPGSVGRRLGAGVTG